MQIVSLEDNTHEMSSPIFYRNENVKILNDPRQAKGYLLGYTKCASISAYACAQYHQGIHSELLHSIISRHSISGHRML